MTTISTLTRLALIFAFALVSLFLFVKKAEVSENEVTNIKAIEIARAYINKYKDYNLDFMGITVDKYFTLANKHLPTDQLMFDIDYNKKQLLEKSEELKTQIGEINENKLIEKRKRINTIKDTLKKYNEFLKLIQKLKGKTYWAVNFFTISPSPTVPVLGGSYTVFIDAKTGDYILSFEGL